MTNVYDHEGKRIGQANNFAQAMSIHRDHYAKIDSDRYERYAGINCQQQKLHTGFHPVFYMEDTL